MRVFSLYGKILKKNFISVIAYIIAFLAITLLFVGNQGQTPTTFNNQRVAITIVDLDEDKSLTPGLIDYLGQYAIIKEFESDSLLDALYYREIYGIYTIPEDFTATFIDSGEVTISREAIPDAEYYLTNIDYAINRYLNLVQLYQNNLPTHNLSDILVLIEEDLVKEAIATRTTIESNVLNNAVYYFNYLSYVLFAIIMSIVGIVSLRLKRLDVKRRMLISPYLQSKTNLEVLLGHGVLAIGLVITTYIMSLIFYPTIALSIHGLLFFLNSCCLAFAILTISYTIGLLVKSENALPAIANVVSLGSSFLTGVFVPQFLLGEEVLAIAHVLPNYYYVANNERIAAMSTFSWEASKSIFLYMVIELLFGLAFVFIAIFVARSRNREEA